MTQRQLLAHLFHGALIGAEGEFTRETGRPVTIAESVTAIADLLALFVELEAVNPEQMLVAVNAARALIESEDAVWEPEPQAETALDN